MITISSRMRFRFSSRSSLSPRSRASPRRDRKCIVRCDFFCKKPESACARHKCTPDWYINNVNVVFMQLFHRLLRNFRMVTTALILNDHWDLDFSGRRLALSTSCTCGGESAIVAVTETGGIGSVFSANSEGVECYLGARGDGVHEAFARALVSVLGTQQLLLTLAIRDISPAIISALLASIREHTDKLK